MTKDSKRESEKPKKQEPTGQEIMRRRPPSDLGSRPARFEFDPYKAYSLDQLAKIGAVAVKFTQLEHMIDFVGSYILLGRAPFWLKISIDKALSTSSKLNLLEHCVDRARLLDERKAPDPRFSYPIQSL